MTQTVSAALARKLSVGQQEQGDKPRSVLRALRLAFARAAGERLQLPLSVIGAKSSCRDPDALTGIVGEDWLLLQFDSGERASAVICMDPGVVSAVVQVQTIGEVVQGVPSPRAFTDTDAAMVAPLVEDALSRAVSLVDSPGDQLSLSGFEFASRLAHRRALSLAMVEDAYQIFELTVELGGGLRQGQISVILPVQPAENDDFATQNEVIGPNLEQASGVLRAELNTVICKVSLPLAALPRLQPGDVLPLAGSRLDRAEILTIDQTRVAIGRLGQCGGMRAVRLNEYRPVPAFSQPDTEGFLETHSPTRLQTEPDVPAMAKEPLASASFEPNAAEDLEASLNFADSDQMVAEISQLAGLAPVGEDANDVG